MLKCVIHGRPFCSALKRLSHMLHLVVKFSITDPVFILVSNRFELFYIGPTPAAGQAFQSLLIRTHTHPSSFSPPSCFCLSPLMSSGSGASLSCIFGGEDEKSREDQSRTSAVLYATFNSFIYVFVLEHFELALQHLCRMFVSL